MQFARYADDAVGHARSLAQAQQVLEAMRKRLAQCGLALHPAKTQIVDCQEADRTASSDHVPFDFLGYTFAPRQESLGDIFCPLASSGEPESGELHPCPDAFLAPWSHPQ
jgi:hypothetical protein